MNTATNTIRSEHRAVGAVIHGLQYLVQEMRDKRAAPRFDVLKAMIYYIDTFPERLHHPKEDRYLFRRLRERTHAADQALSRLEEQHRQGAQMIRELEQSILRYEQGGAAHLEGFARRVQEYADFHWEHMRMEEDVILPLAEKTLQESDWAEIDEAFAGNVDPLIGEQLQRNYKNLFTRIVAIAPPPIGVGPANP
jgi:hemerythrin-like domain-containing protein